MNKQIGILVVVQLISFTLVANAKNDYDVQHVKLDLSFNWKQKQAFGTATFTIKIIQNTKTIVLDAAYLSIKSITDFSSKQLLVFKNDTSNTSNNLVVNYNKTLFKNSIVSFIIEYNSTYQNRANPNAIGGSFGKGLRFFEQTSTTPSKLQQIWSSGEPKNNAYWFPCKGDISDIHTTEIIGTVPKPLMLISNGELVSVTNNRNSTRTFHYKTLTPFSNYLVSVVVGEYTPILQTNANTKIITYGYLHEKKAVQATVELLPDMMRFLEDRTGCKYPFNSYKQVVVQDYPFPGLVGQHSCSILSDNYIDDYGVHKDFKYLWDGVAMQALANQWFGNLIMPKTWNDIWLNNAFAHYFAGLFTAKTNSKDEYLLWYYNPFEKPSVLGDWNANYKHPIVMNNIKELTAFAGDNYSKLRGALVLRMLQKELGDEVWWKVIKYYVHAHAHKQVNTKNFEDAVEKISGKNYKWFFQQWVYKIGLPKFKVEKSYNATTQKLTIIVTQIQTKDSISAYEQVDYFEGKIDIEIDGVIKTISLKPIKENIFTFQLNAQPNYINFNVHETFLCEIIFEKTKEEWLHILQSSTDVLAKQQAIDKLITIANDSTTNSIVKNEILQAFFSQINANNYWRYKQYVLVAIRRTSTMPYNEAFITLLKKIALGNENAWLRSSAIGILGNTKDSTNLSIYINLLKDTSDRVINAAANAIGKTKSKQAFNILMNLENQPSWKNQNRISALNGLQWLGDERAVEYVLNCIRDNASPRWYLATPTWDYPFAAINTIMALGKGELAYPILIDRLKASLMDSDINDIFQNVQLINLLKDDRAKEMYSLLKTKFKKDHEILEAVNGYETQFLESIKK